MNEKEQPVTLAEQAARALHDVWHDAQPPHTMRPSCCYVAADKSEQAQVVLGVVRDLLAQMVDEQRARAEREVDPEKGHTYTSIAHGIWLAWDELGEQQ